MNVTPIAVTIVNGQSLSAGIPLGTRQLHAVAMPAAWDAAHLTFQVSVDGGATWLEMTTSAGAAVDYTVAAAQFIAIDPTLWRAANMIKVRSGASGAAVNQTADRILTLITKPIA